MKANIREKMTNGDLLMIIYSFVWVTTSLIVFKFTSSNTAIILMGVFFIVLLIFDMLYLSVNKFSTWLNRNIFKDKNKASAEFWKKIDDGEVFVFDGRALKDGIALDYHNKPFPAWIRELGDCIGKEAILHNDGERYILEAISSTEDDYYYVLRNKENKLIFISCEGKINIL